LVVFYHRIHLYKNSRWLLYDTRRDYITYLRALSQAKSRLDLEEVQVGTNL